MNDDSRFLKRNLRPRGSIHKLFMFSIDPLAETLPNRSSYHNIPLCRSPFSTFSFEGSGHGAANEQALIESPGLGESLAVFLFPHTRQDALLANDCPWDALQMHYSGLDARGLLQGKRLTDLTWLLLCVQSMCTAWPKLVRMLSLEVSVLKLCPCSKGHVATLQGSAWPTMLQGQ
jgi:hypothetical protein